MIEALKTVFVILTMPIFVLAFIVMPRLAVPILLLGVFQQFFLTTLFIASGTHEPLWASAASGCITLVSGLLLASL